MGCEQLEATPPRRLQDQEPQEAMENPMDGGAWQAAVHGVAKSQTGLSDFTTAEPREKPFIYATRR